MPDMDGAAEWFLDRYRVLLSASGEAPTLNDILLYALATDLIGPVDEFVGIISELIKIHREHSNG